jgi:histidine triad (HIT) family protein
MDTLFDKIIRREIPADIVYENEHVLAFRDITPQAPVHVLVIPKKPVKNILEMTSEHTESIGQVMLACGEIAKLLGVAESGVRVVLNAGDDAGQTIPYLHAHVLGGRPLTWPPG